MFVHATQKSFLLAILIFRARAGTRNKFPTSENNILDLVITSIPDKIIINELLKPSDSKILTDHSAILFELTAACSPLQKVNRFVFDYQ